MRASKEPIAQHRKEGTMYRLAVSAGGSRGDLDPRRFEEDMRAADEGGVDSVWIGESWGPNAITQLALAAA